MTQNTVHDIEYGTTDDGGPSWGIRGEVSHADFIATLIQDEHYKELDVKKGGIGLPTAEDLSVDTIVYDLDEPEHSFSVPDMQDLVDEHINEANASGYDVDMSDPQAWTWVSWEAGWPHQHPQQNG